MEKDINKNNNSEKTNVKKAAPPPMKKGDGKVNTPVQKAKKELEKEVKDEKKAAPVPVVKETPKKEENIAETKATNETKEKNEDIKPVAAVNENPQKADPASGVKASKNNLKIIIPIVAVVLIAVIIAVALVSNKSRQEPIIVTDSNGVPVTDENGNIITVTPETEVIYVTDENGNILKDAEGNDITTIVYKDLTVGVPVTDMNGALVTDAKGNAVTENIKVNPTNNYVNTTKNNVVGTSSVPLTDGQGNTGVDSQGNLITTIIDITTDTAPNIEPAKTEWKNTRGGSNNDKYTDVILTADGCYITANITNSKDGDFTDYKSLALKSPYTVLTKYDKSGAIIWEKAIGSTEGLAELSKLSPCADGSFYAAGHRLTSDGKGNYDAVICKMDKNGATLWTKTLGTSTVDSVSDVITTSDGSVVAVGFVGNNDGDAAGAYDKSYESRAFIIKYSSSGKLLFKKFLGGNNDYLNAVVEAKDGSFFAVASLGSNAIFKNLGWADAAVIKFSKDGKMVGKTSLAGTDVDVFNSIMATSDGGIIVAGHSKSSDFIEESFFKEDFISRGAEDVFVIKYDNDLNIKFVTPLRGQNSDTVESITELDNGTFIVAGSTNSSTRDFKGVTTRGMKDIFIAAFNNNGDLCWVRSFGGTLNDGALALCKGADGGYVVVGETRSKDVDLKGIAPYGGNGKTIGIMVKFPE